MNDQSWLDQRRCGWGRLIEMYLAGRMNDDQMRRMNRHFQECQQCAGNLTAARETLNTKSSFLRRIAQRIRRVNLCRVNPAVDTGEGERGASASLFTIWK